ncbi:MAG TPA: ammonium transporter [Acidimicrobiales bacterium]|nr:ammonium transporter [Acidimicrobiales bacterium]
MQRHLTRLARASAVVVPALLFATTAIAAADPTGSNIEGPESLDKVGIGLNLMWIIVGAVLVVFMQAGFALVETGFCRAKHAAHVVSTNFAIFGLGFVGFFLCGFAFMFGGFSYPGVFGMDQPIGEALLGSGNWVFLWKGGFALSGDKAYDVAVAAFFLYMVAFMDTVATIPTGAMAERWKWRSFVGWGLFCGAVYYPLFGAWTWGGGWLAKLGISKDLGFGYVDFAGSGVVHAVGGIAALAGAVVLGPRIGKYGPDGKARSIPGHHIPMAMLGCFILLFGWFGFNAASTFAATDLRFTIVATNTAIAAAFGATMAMFWVMRRTGKPDPGMMVNGMLAGLVAITAPCAFVQPWAAAVIGTISGVTVIEAAWIIERKMKVDDPVGAIAVHLVHGIFGVLCVGIFSDGSYGQMWNGTDHGDQGVTGILYGSLGWGQLLVQAIGAVTIIVVIGGIAYAFFSIQNKLTKGGIRPSAEDEIGGMDLPEMGALAYPEFEFAIEESDPEIGHRPLVGSSRSSGPDEDAYS